jgi:hypothetical protein
MAHYGKETHGYCVKCDPPRRIFVGDARPPEEGSKLVDLTCPLHGAFQVEEEQLEHLSGQF